MQSKRLKNGLTLTELLIVIIIIGILATLSFPSMVKTLEKAKTGEVVANLNLIRTAQKSYFLENNAFTDEIGELNIEDPNEAASRYFDYSIVNADEDNFMARAQRRDAPNPYDTYHYIIRKEGQIFSNGPFFPALRELREPDGPGDPPGNWPFDPGDGDVRGLTIDLPPPVVSPGGGPGTVGLPPPNDPGEPPGPGDPPPPPPDDYGGEWSGEGTS